MPKDVILNKNLFQKSLHLHSTHPSISKRTYSLKSIRYISSKMFSPKLVTSNEKVTKYKTGKSDRTV